MDRAVCLGSVLCVLIRSDNYTAHDEALGWSDSVPHFDDFIDELFIKIIWHTDMRCNDAARPQGGDVTSLCHIKCWTRHVLIMYRSCVYQVSFMCWSCIVHVLIMCRSCVDQVSFMCWSGDSVNVVSPVELVDVLDVSKQRAHLFRTDGQVTLIDDVSQVILQGAEHRAQVIH